MVVIHLRLTQKVLDVPLRQPPWVAPERSTPGANLHGC